jgi:dihydroorotate dehydrogenase
MNIYENFFKKIIFLIDPEKAHRMAVKVIKYNTLFDFSISEYMKPYLSQNIFGIDFYSPVGLAAGFDKNCELYSSVHKCGFGFSEMGTVTPLSQYGNQKPRIFRLIEDDALINSLGFNNEGIENFIKNAIFSKIKKIPIGINIGPNKDSIDFKEDYKILLDKIYENHFLFDYITINISSPNTKNLRDFHEKNMINDLLETIFKTNNDSIDIDQNNQDKLPIFLKISPDINFENEEYLQDFLDQILSYKEIKGLIISNTTIDKSLVNKKYYNFSGGVSGKPLFSKSTNLLKKIYSITRKYDIKLIGVGGVFSAEDAYCKIKSGASLVQLYTSMIYKGPFIANEINRGLIRMIQNDGFLNIKDVVGIDAE